MDIFKIDVNRKAVRPITLEHFARQTNLAKPWYQTIQGHEDYFAVCPACDNPIQIVGMLELPKLYGKHFFHEEEENFYPYYDKRQKFNIGFRRRNDSPAAQAIKNMLIEQFDRVIDILSKTVGLKISIPLAEAMLRDYKAASGWCDRRATLDNIPWTFACLGSAKRLCGRILTDVNLAHALCAKRSDIIYTEEGRITTRDEKNAPLCDVRFCFICYKQKLVDDALEETIEFNLFDKQNQTLCKKIVRVESGYFNHLIHSEKHNAFRRPELVALAQHVLR